ncbi:MAG: N-acetylmuramoyl-L-alanine amidase [Nitrospirae bacterium]|nr:N-acetylmuramoyl-L-alanine amidase [Nitrospirota bacterium]
MTRAEAAEEVSVKDLRYWSDESYTRVVIDLDGPVTFTENRLSNPDRLYFDLKGCKLSKDVDTSFDISNGILKSIRVGQFDNDTVRIVLDLGKFERNNVFVLEDPYRFVIDIYGEVREDTSPADRELSGSVVRLPSVERKSFKRLPGVRRVVIDPGHGGKDAGAIGPRGLYEKDVVLDVAKKLKKILTEKHKIEVILTRDRDIFIPLEERTAIANSQKADLFISIHANANPRRDVRGIETYLLNWTNDKEAMRVAARENAISIEKMQRVQNDLQVILSDLARDNKRDESMRLAHNVQTSIINTLKSDYQKIVDNGVKHALFYVLVGAQMPSILVEISFISNREEEKRLSSALYRKKIAEAIAGGIHEYRSLSEHVAKVNGRF